MFGCSICDTLALHLPETESLLSGSVVAIFQRDNYEFSITDPATQILQRQVDRLCRVVHVMQQELAEYRMEDHSVGALTNGNGVGGNNGMAYEVGDGTREQ